MNEQRREFIKKDRFSCIAKIKSIYPSLYSAEKAVADYVLENIDRVKTMSVSQVAESTGVAESTIVRFCQNLGFKGYQEFKITLSHQLVAPLQQIHEDISEGDGQEEVTRKVFGANYRALEDTLRLLDPAEMSKAVDAICSCKRLFLIAFGSSSPIAIDGYYRFLRLGINSSYILDPLFQVISAGHFGKGSVFLGISHSGSSKDIVQAMKVAKEKGAKTIAITGYLKSPILKHSDIKLISGSQETVFRNDAMSSRIAQLSIIDALYVNVAMNQKDRSVKALQETDELMSSKQI